MADVTLLSADELMSELRKHGLKVGPITPTTRKLFENKLLKARGAERHVPDCEQICVVSPSKTVDSTDSGESNHNRMDSSTEISTSFHYGVCFNRSNSDGNTEPAVFSSQQQALRVVKQLKDKGARFKSFKTREEAERFSLSSVSSTPSSPIQKPVDPVGTFKKPSPQELIQFRKLIETGNFQEFLNIVNNNPKYLISSGDTPVVLQEGFRYNAMHIAAKENKAGICKLIVDTVESEKFWIHYLSLHEDMKLSPIHYRRKQFLVDLYLNTPDKGNFETPLHFACKYGHVDVVKYLVSHPLTNNSPRNKYGDMPSQIICSRCSSQTGSVSKMEKIKHALEDNYYVPVFGSEGDASPPTIGEPWSPDVSDYNIMSPSSTHSPVDLKMTVRAYAGPMSPSKAVEFHQQWKTPPKSKEKKKKYEGIRRGDSTRGLERIGRELAHSQNVPWVEYWGFLGSFVDLAHSSGLERLEKYFNDKFSKLKIDDTDSKQLMPNATRNQEASGFLTPTRTASNSSSVFLSERSLSSFPPKHEVSFKSIGNDIQMTSMTLNDRLNERHTYASNDDYESLDLKAVGSKHSGDNFQSPVRAKSVDDENDDGLFLCKTNLLEKLKDLNIEDNVNTLDINGRNNKESQQQQSQHVAGLTRTFSDEIHEDPRDRTSSSSENNDVSICTMPVFINGLHPSKTDLDVLRALDDVAISRDTYPWISQWRDRVMTYTTSARESWPSPGSPLCRSRQKSLLTTSY